jgi:hypothetical protein
MLDEKSSGTTAYSLGCGPGQAPSLTMVRHPSALHHVLELLALRLWHELKHEEERK